MSGGRRPRTDSDVYGLSTACPASLASAPIGSAFSRSPPSCPSAGIPSTPAYGPDQRDIPRIVSLSRATYRKMVQNLWWAAGYNIVAIPLAAGVLAGQGILLTPAIGAVLMSLSTVIVAVNAQLLRRVTL